MMILSDEQYVNDCKTIENTTVIPMTNSKTPEEASTHKLNIFEYEKTKDYISYNEKCKKIMLLIHTT